MLVGSGEESRAIITLSIAPLLQTNHAELLYNYYTEKFGGVANNTLQSQTGKLMIPFSDIIMLFL